MRSLFTRLASDERGAALAEAAIIMPTLALISFGLLEFGNIFYYYQQVTTGVRDAARFLARAPLNDQPTDTCSNAINRRTAAAQNLAVYGQIGGASGLTPRVPGWTTVTAAITTIANPIDVDTGSSIYRGTSPLCLVRVSTNFTYPQIGLLRAFRVPDLSIAVTHTERWIGG